MNSTNRSPIWGSVSIVEYNNEMEVDKRDGMTKEMCEKEENAAMTAGERKCVVTQ